MYFPIPNHAKTNNEIEYKSIEEKHNNTELKHKPMYILTVEWDEGKSVNLEVYPHSKPQEIAYNFCKKYNLAFCSLEILTEQIKCLLINNSSSDNTENNNTTNNNQPNTNDNERLKDKEERKSMIINQDKQCLSETKSLFDPSEFMYQRIKDSQKSMKKPKNDIMQAYTSSQKKENKPKDLKHKRISLFTIEENEKRLKDFLSNNAQFTELLFQKSKLKHSKDEGDDISIIKTANISSHRISNDSQNMSNININHVSLQTHNHYENQRKKIMAASSRGKRSYSLLNNHDSTRNYLSNGSNDHYLDKPSFYPMKIHNYKRYKP